MRILSIFAFLGLMTSSQVLAADGSSGCGAGWYVFKESTLVSSSLRSSTNVTFSSTFGMTSGTSNCSKHSIVENNKKAVHFAENNYPVLIQDLARGSGESLGGLAYVMGCNWQSYDAFATKIQTNFESVVPTNDSPADLVGNVHELIGSDAALSAACGVGA